MGWKIHCEKLSQGFSSFLAAGQKVVSISGNDPVEVVPNALSPGFKQDDYSKERSNRIIVGYFGHLTDSWFDWDSMIKIAESRPDYIFEIIGHSEPENLKLPSNAYS